MTLLIIHSYVNQFLLILAIFMTLFAKNCEHFVKIINGLLAEWIFIKAEIKKKTAPGKHCLLINYVIC